MTLITLENRKFTNYKGFFYIIIVLSYQMFWEIALYFVTVLQILIY